MKAINIGRAPDNELVLKESTISRYHARIFNKAEHWYIIDLQSTHGTYLNDKSIREPTPIKRKDRIKFSDTEVVFEGDVIKDKNGAVLLELLTLTGTGKKVSSGGNNLKALSSLLGKKSAVAILSFLIIIIAVFMFLRPAGILGISFGKTPPQLLEQEIVEYGTIEFLSGKYTGEMVNGIPHGYGILIYASPGGSMSFHDLKVQRGQQVYSGNWKNGLKHGLGEMIYPDGSVVQGYWENDNYIGSERN